MLNNDIQHPLADINKLSTMLFNEVLQYRSLKDKQKSKTPSKKDSNQLSISQNTIKDLIRALMLENPKWAEAKRNIEDIQLVDNAYVTAFDEGKQTIFKSLVDEIPGTSRSYRHILPEEGYYIAGKLSSPDRVYPSPLQNEAQQPALIEEAAKQVASKIFLYFDIATMASQCKNAKAETYIEEIHNIAMRNNGDETSALAETYLYLHSQLNQLEKDRHHGQGRMIAAMKASIKKFEQTIAKEADKGNPNSQKLFGFIMLRKINTDKAGRVNNYNEFNSQQPYYQNFVAIYVGHVNNSTTAISNITNLNNADDGFKASLKENIGSFSTANQCLRRIHHELEKIDSMVYQDSQFWRDQETMRDILTQTTNYLANAVKPGYNQKRKNGAVTFFQGFQNALQPQLESNEVLSPVKMDTLAQAAKAGIEALKNEDMEKRDGMSRRTFFRHASSSNLNKFLQRTVKTIASTNNIENITRLHKDVCVLNKTWINRLTEWWRGLRADKKENAPAAHM